MNEYKKSLKIFRAFSDEKRLAILELLRAGEKCACVLLDELDLTQSGLSYHMKILTESGIVSGRQEGKWMYYSISKEASKAAADLLLELTDAK